MWRTFVSWMDRREDALSLAGVRVTVGLVVFAHLVHMAWLGVPGLVWVDADQGGFRDLGGPLIDRLGGPTPETIAWLVPATAWAALLMALGLFTRLAILLTWFGFRILGDLNSHAGGSYDELLQNTLFLLLLSGSEGRLSLDARLFGVSRLVPAWPRYLMVVQLAWMYLATGLQKLSIHWVPWGELDALWYILQQPTWQRIPFDWAWPFYPLTRLGTLGTWLFEMAAPLLPLALILRADRTRPGRLRAWLNRVDFRTRYLMVGVLLHLGIELTLEVGPFSFATWALYLACFHPDEWPRRFARYSSARISTRSSPGT